jgi:Asp-tRNA(Asn)/Glu-tRNA(Gln) amidotransferase A subunit family amidase
LTGRAMDEATVLRVGDVFERATPFARERPPV